MKSPGYWRDHYVVETDADDIETSLGLTSFISDGKRFELPYFEKGMDFPNILISPG